MKRYTVALGASRNSGNIVVQGTMAMREILRLWWQMPSLAVQEGNKSNEKLAQSPRTQNKRKKIKKAHTRTQQKEH